MMQYFCGFELVSSWELGIWSQGDVISIPTLLLTNCTALGKILNFLCLSLPIYIIEPHQTFLDMVI